MTTAISAASFVREFGSQAASHLLKGMQGLRRPEEIRARIAELRRQAREALDPAVSQVAVSVAVTLERHLELRVVETR
jgi:hypothetical protein